MNCEEKIKELEKEIELLKKQVKLLELYVKEKATRRITEAINWLLENENKVITIKELKEKFPCFKTPQYLSKLKRIIDKHSDLEYIVGVGRQPSKIVNKKSKYMKLAIQIFNATPVGGAVDTKEIEEIKGKLFAEMVRKCIVKIYNDGKLNNKSGRLQCGDIWHIKKKY